MKTSANTRTKGSEKGKILVLSPHPDDAALSVGGLMQKPAFRNSIHILTLFGRSNYTRDGGFQDDWEAVSKRRKREDTAFAARIGAQLTYLDFSEAALRVSYDRVFAINPAVRAAIPRGLRRLMFGVIDQLKPALLLAPLGIGGHLDHLITRDVARRYAGQRGIPVIHYEDLFYASYLSNRQIVDHVRSVEPSLRPTYISVKSELKSKLDNLKLYRSQLRDDAIHLIERYATHWKDRAPSERLWSSARAGANEFFGEKQKG